MLNSQNPLLNYGLQPPQPPLIQNPLASQPQPVPAVTLGLTQIDGFDPVPEFVDSSNTRWKLVKAASNSTVDIPDPSGLQIISAWGHEFPGLKNSRVYLYVVEALRQPRVETERPARILYQWFSTTAAANFNASLISQQEWLKANVYAAEVTDARVSMVQALCKCTPADTVPAQRQEPAMIHVEELNNGQAAGRDQSQN